MTRHLITSALPYINGVKHLGNLIGSQLPADVYGRFLRQRGEEVLLVCATDEHGTPAELAAKEAGLPVAEFCRQQHEVQRDIGELEGYFENFARRHPQLTCCMLRYQPEIGPDSRSPFARYLSLPAVPTQLGFDPRAVTRQLDQAHAAVPPTVRPSISRVG